MDLVKEMGREGLGQLEVWVTNGVDCKRNMNIKKYTFPLQNRRDIPMPITGKQ